MKRFSALSVIMAFVLIISGAIVMIGPRSANALNMDVQVHIQNAGDPCQNPNVAKNYAVFSATTSTVLSVVTNTLATTVYVCDVVATTSAASTFQLVSGSTSSSTSAKCDTGATNITPSFALPTNGNLYLGYGGVVTKGTVSTNLCTSTTGTLSGIITYVNQ
jgi:hypothetical protein